MITHTSTQNIELWSIDRLVEYPRNPRKNDVAVDRMCAFAAELDVLVADARAQLQDLNALDQRLTQLEEDMIAIARSHETETDAMHAGRTSTRS